ncbi:MAG: DinB family protein, partial [Chloroflexi bacterium]|nr:DinB family protein [Chloroflexota bacterium]
MLDFSRVWSKEMTMAELAASLTPSDLRKLTDEMIDAQLKLIADCVDADVTFAAEDPGANDTFASNQAETNIAWTLGHVIVHATASSEVSAALAAELARGVEYHGRSRSEVPWETVTTIAECR